MLIKNLEIIGFGFFISMNKNKQLLVKIQFVRKNLNVGLLVLL